MALPGARWEEAVPGVLQGDQEANGFPDNESEAQRRKVSGLVGGAEGLLFWDKPWDYRGLQVRLRESEKAHVYIGDHT